MWTLHTKQIEIVSRKFFRNRQTPLHQAVVKADRLLLQEQSVGICDCYRRYFEPFYLLYYFTVQFSSKFELRLLHGLTFSVGDAKGKYNQCQNRDQLV